MRSALNLRHLRGFVAVAREGNFTRAAESLLLSQSALTITVRQLEDEIGVTLFNRTTRQVNLTIDGTAFLPVAERLLEDFERAISDLRTAAMRRGGLVDIAVLPSIAIRLMPAIVEHFRERYPSIRLGLHDDNARGVQRQVRHNEVDFGISNLWQPHPELEFTPLIRDRMGVVCPADHPLAKGKGPLSWRELRTFPFFIMAADTGVNATLMAAQDLPDWVRAPAGEVLAMITLVEMIRAGLGITVLPELAEPSRSDPTLVFRRLVNPTVEREICIVTRGPDLLQPPPGHRRLRPDRGVSSRERTILR
jgi:DNA-binding transcriptional LysR family regulator